MIHLKKTLFRHTLLLGLTILSLSFFNSCSKEDISGNTPGLSTAKEEITLREEGDGHVDADPALAILNAIPYSDISTDAATGALQFSDDSAASETLSALQSAEETYQEEIRSSISGLSEEEIDEMEINESYILEQFEMSINFQNSLRAQEAAQMDTFLENEELDEENDPSDDFAYVGPGFFKSVLNQNAEIRIGNEISKVMPDGGNYTIIDGNLSTLDFLRTNPSFEDIENTPNIKIIDKPTEDAAYNCHAKRIKKAVHYHTEGWKKYRASISLRVYNFSFLWFNKHFVSARLFSYRKTPFFNKWKKHTTDITIKMAGNVYYSLYINSTCAIWEYNPDTQQWEIVGYEPCVTVRDCAGGGVFIDTIDSTYDWFLNLQVNFNQRISVSDQDGPNGILKARYHWKGNVYELAMYP